MRIFFHASLRDKMENNSPGGRSEERTDLRWVKRKGPEDCKISELSLSSLWILVAGQDFFLWFPWDILSPPDTMLILILSVPSLPVEGEEKLPNAGMGSGSDLVVPDDQLPHGSALPFTWADANSFANGKHFQLTMRWSCLTQFF